MDVGRFIRSTLPNSLSTIRGGNTVTKAIQSGWLRFFERVLAYSKDVSLPACGTQKV